MTQIMINPFRWKQLPQLGDKLKNKKGFTVLTLVIILSSILLIISLSIGLNSIAENQISLYSSKNTQILINSEGCAQEALIRLSRNNLYLGETLTLNETTCIITVSPPAQNRTISISASNGNYNKDLQIDVTIAPITITSWRQIAN